MIHLIYVLQMYLLQVGCWPASPVVGHTTYTWPTHLEAHPNIYTENVVKKADQGVVKLHFTSGMKILRAPLPSSIHLSAQDYNSCTIDKSSSENCPSVCYCQNKSFPAQVTSHVFFPRTRSISIKILCKRQIFF